MFKVDTEMTGKELNACKKEMINHGTYPVHLKGSGKEIRRDIYERIDGNQYIVWYKKFIAVTRGRWGYVTVEDY